MTDFEDLQREMVAQDLPFTVRALPESVGGHVLEGAHTRAYFNAAGAFLCWSSTDGSVVVADDRTADARSQAAMFDLILDAMKARDAAS